ncbi:uncharacterized protein A1O9_06485 [Exophiala aquamarina CBS 119918]|uniref:Uncharacterized protein n=1 Tax=Exophiala aquamarina CBS 119918 TaxID=1182545 RepID=A0A072PEL5_9EURO|nr:uncharacterized protein A1O9_06485 [Exophiala aquamarina CBS 119918]KEF58559.1 hypothetical protein A1O9_06485 [Exophiala aquamarina CBS 119918]
MDDVELPPLHSSTHETAPRLPRSQTILLTRKRTHTDYDDDTITSSDPALFSSDEHAPDAENYLSGKRKKKTYQGSWWDNQRVKMSNPKKREFRRNFDSGVFMGSETSDEALSSDSFGLEDELLRDQQEKNQYSRASQLFATESVETTTKAKAASRPMIPVASREYDAVCQVVQHALDRGKEDVDLS